MKYVQRLVDKELDKRLKAFNAVNIIGPKGCGKTRTAKERIRSYGFAFRGKEVLIGE